MGSTVADLRAACGDRLVVRDDDPTFTVVFGITDDAGGTERLIG